MTPFRMFAWRPEQIPFAKWTIVTGDFVKVISGKNKGREGKVLRVFRKTNQVLVQGINYKFKTIEDDDYVRRKKTVQKEYPLHVSNVALIDPESGKATRVKTGVLPDGSRVRVSVKSGAVIPKPDRNDLKYLNRTSTKEAGPLDTKPEDVLEKTYQGEDFYSVKKEFEEFLRIKKQKEDNPAQ